MVGGGVCKVIFMSNPTVELRLGLGSGFDNVHLSSRCHRGRAVSGEIDEFNRNVMNCKDH